MVSLISFANVSVEYSLSVVDPRVVRGVGLSGTVDERLPRLFVFDVVGAVKRYYTV